MTPQDDIDIEWLDICEACERSSLVTWQDWISNGHHDLTR